MIPDKAYELAKSGGWEGWKLLSVRSWQENALDPEFFQALGKSLGWQGKHDPQTDMLVLQAHFDTFSHLILQGKDTTEFWKELLEEVDN